jgi:hypothetical protein
VAVEAKLTRLDGRQTGEPYTSFDRQMHGRTRQTERCAALETTSLDTQTSAAKRSRTIGMCFTAKSWGGTDLEIRKGPVHGRPMPLNLDHGSEIVNQQEYDGGASSVIRGKRPQRSE